MRVFEIWHLVGFYSGILIVGFIPMTKMTLGAILTLFGAFFPRFAHGKDDYAGHASVRVGERITVDFHGTLRFSVIVAGIVLIAASVVEGTAKWWEAGAPGATELNHVVELDTADVPAAIFEQVTGIPLKVDVPRSVITDDLPEAFHTYTTTRWICRAADDGKQPSGEAFSPSECLPILREFQTDLEELP